DVVKSPREVKRRVGYVPDRAFLYPKLTAREFLEFVGHLYERDPQDVARVSAPLLERFDLSEWIDELIESYSHGMRQKLALTAAMIHEPEILVIDEPMVGLDPRSARVMKTLLADLVAGGRTVFLSTHTLEIAEQLCSRVAIVQKGLVIADGTLEELRIQAMTEGSLEAVFLRLTEGEAFVAEEEPLRPPARAVK
ncbi:MAG TPA: ABC transporter ATP-binding protein, partial [Gemmatimonadota bacterium]|nr:ABC transporter ATP-binding protein [Gemmatimonadota bacterium]